MSKMTPSNVYDSERPAGEHSDSLNSGVLSRRRIKKISLGDTLCILTGSLGSLVMNITGSHDSPVVNLDSMVIVKPESRL